MDTSIAKSDAIPLINLVWQKSFARKSTNKNAIRDQGWYPVNRKLLQDPKILKTKMSSTTGTDIPPNPMNPPDRSGRRTHSNPCDATTTQQPTHLITTRATMDDVSDISNVSELSSTTTAASATLAVLDALNFDSGVASDFTLDILQHLVKKESACDNLHNRYEDGRSLR
jgi:hypothetical protein